MLLKKEVNGFIINRLQYALLMEAWRLVEVRSWRAGALQPRERGV